MTAWRPFEPCRENVENAYWRTRYADQGQFIADMTRVLYPDADVKFPLARIVADAAARFDARSRYRASHETRAELRGHRADLVVIDDPQRTAARPWPGGGGDEGGL